MRLVDLEPRFLKITVPGKENRYVDTIAEADGVIFLCPKCIVTNGGPVGTHPIICWAPHVPQTEQPTPGRWNLVGAGYDDLSLVAGSSSVLLQGGCNAHFFVERGEIRMC